MPSLRKVFDAVVSGRSDGNVRFNDLRRVLLRLGFSERITGGHHIFYRDGVAEIINLQPLAAGGAKPYQVKQVRQTIARYRLNLVDG